MPRIITHTAHGPAKIITKSGDEVWVCRCGLSKNEDGTCDASHKKTLDEKEDEVYCYDESGGRYVVQKMGGSEDSCCRNKDGCGGEGCCGGKGGYCGNKDGCCGEDKDDDKDKECCKGDGEGCCCHEN